VGSLNLVPYLLQVVSQQSSLLAPLAVEAVLKVIDPAKDKNVDLKVCC
jgi:T-complex protein 1 subunit delta